MLGIMENTRECYRESVKEYVIEDSDLLSEGCWWSDLESVKKGFIGQAAWLKDKHSSIEVEGRRLTHLSWPCHLIRALLAVADGVLRCVTPCFLTEAVHHGIEITIRCVKEMINVIIHLDIRIQVNHLAIFLKLQS